MGGHYYPGKDKKRRHMRRKTLWYRTFCSSPSRKACSSLVGLYILIWHAFVPATNWILEVGQQLSSPSSSSPGLKYLKRRSQTSGEWLLYDKTLIIPQDSLEEDQALAKQIASQRGGSTSEYSSKRLHLLELIAPSFFHRNDASKDIDPQQRVKEAVGDTRKSENASNNVDAGKPGKQNLVSEKHDKDIITVGSSPFRTIQNMDSLAANQSGCSRTIANKDAWSTTLVIQTSVNRLWIIKETCMRWLDPIIVVAYIPTSSSSSSLQDADRQVEQQLSVIDAFQSTIVKEHCPHVRIIRYMPDAHETGGSDASEQLKYYPVNRLRNVGLDHVQTSHVMVMDVDFVPSQNLHHTIKSALRHQDRIRTEHPENTLLSSENRQAVIVPAFERQPPQPCETENDCANYLRSNSSFLPRTFDELHQCYDSPNKDCIVFQSKINWEGHFSTRSETWLQRDWYQSITTGKEEEEAGDSIEKKSLKLLECFHSSRYEPYVVLRWCPSSSPEISADSNQQKLKPVAPYYDERFHGYGKNKIELIAQLRLMGYQFAILPEGFIIHNPHPESKVKETWNNNQDGGDLHAQMDKLYRDVFLRELSSMYGHDNDRHGDGDESSTKSKIVKLC